MWTIIYNGTEKSFEDWSAGKARLERNGFHGDFFKFVIDGMPYDSASLFPFMGKLTIMRDRVQAGRPGAYTYSGGSTYFVGWVKSENRTGDSQGEFIQYSLGNILWRMSRLVYEQQWPRILTTHVILNKVPSYANIQLSTVGQLQSILDFVNGRIGNLFAYDLTGTPNIFPPSDEKRDITCDEALRSQLKYIPTLTLRVNYATNDTIGKPTIVLANRSAITGTRVFTHNIGAGVEISSNTISSLDELVASSCFVTYETTSRIGNVDSISVVTDVFPLNSVASDSSFRASAAIKGGELNQQAAVLDSFFFTDAVLGVTQDWLVEKNPWLTNVVANTLTYRSVTFTDKNGTVIIPYDYELRNKGTYHKWMNGNKKDVVVRALVSYTDQSGRIVVDEELTHRITTTDLPPDTYYRNTVAFPGEPVPGFKMYDSFGNPVFNTDPAQSGLYGFSLACHFYNELSVTQYEGEIIIDNNNGEVSANDYAGSCINLSGGLAGWATMNALVQSVSEDLETGLVTVRFGRNKFLSIGELLDLIRVFRQRQFSFYTGQMVTGGANNTDVESPDATAKDDVARGQGTKNKDVISWVDPNDPTKKNITTIDALTNTVTIATQDPADGQIILSLGDLTA